MATRALLLCGEEKAVQAVTQILDELEVSFEHSIESPFALKRLVNQRFDLLIVDCDNVQSATQVFNSARASQLNKTAIAIAIVEGKAGVPNAFRLGASLVLTKPVSLEQARNTLRTGIGMTRKDAQEVKPASMAAAAGTSASGSVTYSAGTGLTPPTVHAASAPTATAPSTTSAPAATSISATTVSTTPTSTSAPATASAVPAANPSSSAPVASVAKSAATPAITAPPSSPLPLRFESQKPTGVAAAVSTPVTSEKSGTSAVIPGTSSSAPSEPKAALTQLMATLSSAPPSASIENAVAKTSSSTVPKSDSSSASLIAELAKPKLDTVKVEEEGEFGDSARLIAEDPFEEPTDTPQTLRNGAVPSFGGLSKHPFAGVEKQSSRRMGILIAGLGLVLAGAGSYAAWITQPKFRNLVVWEYTKIQGWVAGNRTQPKLEAAPKSQSAAMQQASAPTPTPTQPVPSPEQTVTPSQEPIAGSATPSAVASASAANTSEAKPAPESATSKNPPAQNVKQGSAAPRTGAANPVLVPTAGSAAPTNVQTPDAEIFEVPEDYADDQVIHRVHPTYPHQARVKKLHGTVILQAIVNKQGKVDSLQLLSGDPVLAQAAADAVKQWRYKPYSHNGEPAEFQTRITVDFKLP